MLAQLTFYGMVAFKVNEGGAPKLACHGQGGLVRDGSRDDVANQGQSESDKGDMF